MRFPLSEKPAYVAVVTPAAPDFRCDEARLLRRAYKLMAAGCNGIAVFGTTGEGPAFAASERKRTLEALLAAGFPVDRLVVGASAAGPEEAIELSRHAADCGAAVLLMPPFFLAGAADEASIFEFYARAIDAIAGRVPLILYHYPAVSGIPLTISLIRRLLDTYPGAVGGLKDSGGDLGFTARLCRELPELAVLVGSEISLPRAMSLGAAGTICGLANVAPALVARLVDPSTSTEAITALTEFATNGPFVPRLRQMIALLEDDLIWGSPLLPRVAVVDPAFVETFERLRQELESRWNVTLI